MAKTSAGILLYRGRGAALEVLLVHPGGPFWAGRDAGAWTLPKGRPEPGEDLLTAARREFAEETGAAANGPAAPLGQITQAGGKVVHAWAVEGDMDPAALVSNTARIEWPAGTGRWLEVPEVDRAAWFDLAEAGRRINPAQRAFLAALPAVAAARSTHV
ncbi:MAG: NUDIX domain-containing protein [Vicinamibacterales bacterium]